MGLEDLKQEIQRKAQQVAQDILSEAERKAESIRKQAEGEMARLEQEADAQLSERPLILEKREVALRESVSNRMFFEAKKEILDEIYQQAYRKICAMPTEERRRLITGMLNNAQREIEVSQVYANDLDRSLLDSSIESSPLQTDGGLVCETADEKVRMDFRFSTLFDDVTESTIQQTSKLLFE